MRERAHFGAFFAKAKILPLTQPVLDEAVRLRQAKKIKLGDSLVAATALVHGLALVTRNTEDFAGIEELRILNPFVDDRPH